MSAHKGGSVIYEWLHDMKLSEQVASDIGILLTAQLGSAGFENMAEKLQEVRNGFPATVVLLALASGNPERVIGMATLASLSPTFSRKPRFTIEHVAVHKDWERRGIASKLCRDLIKIAKRAEPNSRLDLTSTNPAAVSIYKKLGFVERVTTSLRYKE